MKSIELADYDLITPTGDLPIQVLGVGQIVSSAELFAHDLETSWLVYATKYDSSTYGNPAFWFGYQSTISRLLRERGPALDPISISDDSILRRVMSGGSSRLHVDCTGLATYRAEMVGRGQIRIYPDGYT